MSGAAAPAAALRHLLLHWLALSDNWGFAHFADLLHYEKPERPQLEALLAELATYRQPTLGQPGTYCIKCAVSVFLGCRADGRWAVGLRAHSCGVN